MSEANRALPSGALQGPERSSAVSVWEPNGTHERCRIDNPGVEVSFAGVHSFLYGGPRAFETLSW